MQKDVEFLRSHGLMDYSLLVGIEVTDPRKSAAIQDEVMESLRQ